MDYGLIIQFGSVAAALVGGLAVAKWRVDQTEKRIEKIDTAFHQHQLDVAEKYVSGAAFAKFEADIKNGIDRLTSRLDQVLATRRASR